MKNIFIFPAGTEIAFEILNSLKYSKFVNIIGGTSVSCHAEFVFNNLISNMPSIDDQDFIDVLNEIVVKHKVDYIYPAHDSVVMKLTELKDQVKAQVVTSPIKTVEICRSKAKTYEYFTGEYFLPKVYKKIEDVENYPVFIKPSVGQGSVGAKKINTKFELEYSLKADNDFVICEYLSGDEYTVDCFTDRHGKLRIVSPRVRARTRAGISVRTKLIKLEDSLYQIASIINSKLTFNGAWFFQVKKNCLGEYKLMEISPRIPGTMGISRNLGINFPLLTLYNMWGYDVDILPNEYNILLDRAFISRFKIDIDFDTVYIDFDDTIIVKNKVNEILMMFLYQLKNKKKKIILLTKHDKNIKQSLIKYSISPELFDQIIHIKNNDDKSKYIVHKDSIFIDDSFAERKKVKEKCGIPCFDLDMIESLLDWRI